MNSETHKVIVARYSGPENLYAVPKDWDLEKVLIRYGVFYYDGEEVNPPKVEMDSDAKYPIEVDVSDDYDLDEYFDCEEEEEEEEEEEWFNQQSFKGTSWNYVLDEAEKHFKCSLNSEMNDKERLIHDCLYKLWNKLKEEEEEEEEVRCVCPKCFAEGHTFVSKQRAKELEEMEEMEEMCPFGEKCNGEEEEE